MVSNNEKGAYGLPFLSVLPVYCPRGPLSPPWCFFRPSFWRIAPLSCSDCWRILLASCSACRCSCCCCSRGVSLVLLMALSFKNEESSCPVVLQSTVRCATQCRLSQRHRQALIRQKHLQAVQPILIAGHHLGEYGFQLLVAAGRFVVGAVQAAGAAAQGQIKSGVEGAVAPALLVRVFFAGVGAIHDQGVDAGQHGLDACLALRVVGSAGGVLNVAG